MKILSISKTTARQFILAKNGLLGQIHMHKEDGVLSVVKQAGCLQFDPIDVCGRSPEIVLFARVEGFDKAMLGQLVYHQRVLLDHWDKDMSIIDTRDFPYLLRTRQRMAAVYEQAFKNMDFIGSVMAFLEQNDDIRHDQLPLEGKADFFTWRHRHLAQAVLDYLFFKGDVILTSRHQNLRRYGLTSRHLDSSLYAASDPFPDDKAFLAWQLKRRIGAVGLLWKRASDAFLGLHDFKAGVRHDIFASLEGSGDIIPVRIDGVKDLFYMLSTDQYLVKQMPEPTGRVAFLSPLDHMLWDRKLIRTLFDFDYVWEIYTPKAKRRYGHYTMPVLYRDRLAGRIDLSVEARSDVLRVARLWLEKDVDASFHEALDNELGRFARFHGCRKVTCEYPGKYASIG